MRDLGDYEALGRKTNREEMRLATEIPNPVSDLTKAQYLLNSHVTSGVWVSAGSTLCELKALIKEITYGCKLSFVAAVPVVGTR